MGEEVRTVLPLDEREEALWMLQRLFPDDGISNVGLALYLATRVDPAILHDVALFTVQRHAMLRSVVRTQDGRPCLVIRNPEEVSAEIELKSSTRAGLDADMRDEARRPFDLEHDELIRFTLFELADAAQVLLVVMHHLASDAMSATDFMNDLAASYQSFASGASRPALRTASLVHRTPEPTPESLQYWSERMASLHPGGMLLQSADYTSARPSFAGGRYRRALSASTSDAVRHLRRRTGASNNVVMLTAYLALLARHGAGPDLVVGQALNLRTSEMAGAVGNYFSTVPLAVRATPRTTFAELVDDTFTTFMEALEHRDLSYEGMIRRFGRDDYDWQTPVFRHMFNFRTTLAPSLADHGWVAEAHQIDCGYSRYDLEFVLDSRGGSYNLHVAYRRDVHDESFVIRLADRYEVLLAAAAQDPDQEIGRLAMATHHDKVAELANRTAVRWQGPQTAPAMVSAQIDSRPGNLAMASPAGEISYRRLGQLAGRVHDRLADGAVTPGGIVAVAAGRGPASAAAILAVWRAGAAYLPLDPAQPTERLRYQLRDSGADALVADAATIERLEGAARLAVPTEEILPAPYATDEPGQADAAQPREPDPESIAYVIYTSGSTGHPKAVRITHGNLANVLRHFGRLLEFTAGQKMLWLTTLAFDISALELLLPLSCGGTVVVADDKAQTRPDRLVEIIEEFGVDVVQATPTTWRMVAGLERTDLTGRWLLCGGEPLSGALARRLLATGGRLINVYGPTETTIWSTAEPIRRPGPAGNPAAGRPIANTAVAVLDEFGADCPVDVVGEVVIGGAGVAAGYLGRADLTAERFIHHDRIGRAYRTGDLGRWCPDGRLILHGRRDRQVKVHGGRVELDEVESALRAHPGVTAAAVLLRQPGELAEALAAFVVPRADVTPQELWSHAARILPSYAVPSTITLVAALPTTRNGKTDYVQLATLAPSAPPPDAAPASQPAPAGQLTDEVTTWLVGQWRDLLDNPGIHADSNLFLSGGQSLLAISITDEVGQRYDVDLPPLAIFENPTPRGLAAVVRAHQPGATPVAGS
jgi:amino acid adenylation domain-containing protein